jgi:oligoribonuclease
LAVKARIEIECVSLRRHAVVMAALNRLLWIDMEMTGLDVEKEAIIEVAAIVTDLDFKALDTYETVVNQPRTYIDKMDDWNREHHTASGLVAKIPRGKPQHEVEEDLIKLVQKHWPKIEKKEDKVILAGNSIMQDRLFINRYLPKFAELLHYRMLDVSSYKIIFNNKYNLKYEKKNSHRALNDIQESIDELKFYLGKLH